MRRRQVENLHGTIIRECHSVFMLPCRSVFSEFLLCLRFIPDPVRIEKGVSTTGVIERQLFLGQIGEQSVIVNVEGKGLVIISGCGHQN